MTELYGLRIWLLLFFLRKPSRDPIFFQPLSLRSRIGLSPGGGDIGGEAVVFEVVGLAIAEVLSSNMTLSIMGLSPLPLELE